MRIISGAYKGKTIIVPRNLPVRPTTDFAKEALFNILTNNFSFEDVSVLDLFSGTGNIAYEFVSRGCTSITCVDISFNCVSFIQKTMLDIKAGNAKVVRANVFSYLKNHPLKYDIIFADPPFDLEGKEKLIEYVFANNNLNEHGWLILEHPPTDDFSKQKHFLECRRYNKVNFSIFGYASTQ